MNHKGNSGDDNQHHNRNRVKQHTQIDMQRISEPEPNGIVCNQFRKSARYFGNHKKVLISRITGKQEGNKQSGSADYPGYQRFELIPKKSQQYKKDQGDQDNKDRITEINHR